MEIRIHCRTAFSFMNRNRFRYIVHLQMHLRFNANIIILLELIFPRYSTHSTKFWKREVKRVLLNIGMNSRLNDFLLPIRTFKGDLISISKKSPLISRPNTVFGATFASTFFFFFVIRTRNGNDFCSLKRSNCYKVTHVESFYRNWTGDLSRESGTLLRSSHVSIDLIDRLFCDKSIWISFCPGLTSD